MRFPRLFATFIVIFSCSVLHAQIPMAFTGTPTVTGTAGTVGATYTYSNVGTTGGVTIRAVIEIVAITGGAVLQNIDASTGGSANAWQPVINGSQTVGNCFGMEFMIRFFNAATSAPLTLSSFRANGVDIDGDGTTLREYNTFFSPYSYTVENPTALTLTKGGGMYSFRSPQTQYSGIIITQTNVIATVLFNNRNSMRLRMGSCCEGGNCSAATTNRQHSINFFDAVTYTNAFTLLPVRLTSFTGTKVTAGNRLSWSAEEQDLSHYILERSTNGTDFSEVHRIKAGNNSAHYTYVDPSPSTTQKSFYRLQSVDADGSFTLSTIVSIAPGDLSKSLVITPKTIPGGIAFATESPVKSDVLFQVFGSDGSLAHQERLEINAGKSAVTLGNAKRFSTGMYFVTITTPNEKVIKKVIVP